MQAVILAAGKGSRLNDLTADRPKCMIEIEGRSLIHRSLDALAWAGFREVILVTGYLADKLKAHVGERHGELKIRTRHNQDYNETGSMMSLLAAVPDLDSPDFAIFESDLLFHRDFVAQTCATQGDVILTADISGSGDEVYVCADADGQLIFLGKNADAAQRHDSPGEFAGITIMSQGFLDRYRRMTQELIRRGERQYHYEEVIYLTARAGAFCRVEGPPGLPWTEVDTAADLDRALAVIWPAIVSQDGAAPNAAG
ncbi:MAG: phosphocholine cytidylyltransferase family protein [Alphaproteobacteria bacterium]|nr:phosphocholine cytidylyltransferase family protein [Alphaproteobacteria bacterium]